MFAATRVTLLCGILRMSRVPCLRVLLNPHTQPKHWIIRLKSDTAGPVKSLHQLELLKNLSLDARDKNVPLMTSEESRNKFKVKYILRVRVFYNLAFTGFFEMLISIII